MSNINKTLGIKSPSSAVWNAEGDIWERATGPVASRVAQPKAPVVAPVKPVVPPSMSAPSGPAPSGGGGGSDDSQQSEESAERGTDKPADTKKDAPIAVKKPICWKCLSIAALAGTVIFLLVRKK